MLTWDGLSPETQAQYAVAVVAAILLLPDAERDAWHAALHDRDWPDSGRCAIDPDGWVTFAAPGLTTLRIHGKAVGGVKLVLRDPDRPSWPET